MFQHFQLIIGHFASETMWRLLLFCVAHKLVDDNSVNNNVNQYNNYQYIRLQQLAIMITITLCIHYIIIMQVCSLHHTTIFTFLVATSLNSVKDLVAETAIMKNFSHPNVLQLLGVCMDSSDDDIFKVILPYMSNGDLRNFLRKNRVEPSNIHDFPNVCKKPEILYTCP